MSDVHNTSAQPGKRFNWLVAALIASLAVNLLIVGAVAARWYAGVGPGERYMRLTQTQLIPRRFFSELDRDRRTRLIELGRQHGQVILTATGADGVDDLADLVHTLEVLV